MGILDLFGKKEVPANGDSIYNIKWEMHPLRLEANKNDYIDLDLELVNTFGREALTSIIITVPKPLGLDQSSLSQEREIRLGQVMPGEKIEKKVRIYTNQRTDKGVYNIRVHAISHYHDYAYVLNEARKTIPLRVV